MRAEGGGRRGQSLPPARDARFEGFVDIAEGLGGGGAAFRVGARVADMGEDPAGFGFAGRRFVARFEAKEGIFQRHMQIGWIRPHGLSKLPPGGFVLAGF